MAKIPNKLAKHQQFPGNFCASSGFECIGKLHDLIKEDEFPLQSEPANENAGFDTPKLLALWLDTKSEHLPDTKQAVDLLERETADGKYPLVSMFVWDQQNRPLGWHILMAARDDGTLILIDPSRLAVVAEGANAVAQTLEQNRIKNPERRTIHVLSYKLYQYWTVTKAGEGPLAIVKATTDLAAKFLLKGLGLWDNEWNIRKSTTQEVTNFVGSFLGSKAFQKGKIYWIPT